MSIVFPLCVFRTDMSLRMTCPGQKHDAVLDTKTLLSEYMCVVTDTKFVHYTILKQWNVTYKGIQSFQLYGRIVSNQNY